MPAARPVVRRTLVAPILPLPAGAHVAPGGPFHQQVSERDGAQHVGDRRRQKSDHRFEKGNSASLVYTEPVGRNWLRYKKKDRAAKRPKSSEGAGGDGLLQRDSNRPVP